MREFVLVAFLAVVLASNPARAGDEDATIGLTLYVGAPILALDAALLVTDLYLASHDRPITTQYAILEGVIAAASIGFGSYLIARGVEPTALYAIPGVLIAGGLGLAAHAVFSHGESTAGATAADDTSTAVAAVAPFYGTLGNQPVTGISLGWRF